MNPELIQNIAIGALPILLAITVHEVAHGWTALKFGDRTAQMMGRLTLNPIKHIDPVGTILVPLVLLALGGFVFGWAKPVPVTMQNLNNPKADMAWVALAGPASNLVMALCWLLLMKLSISLSPEFAWFKDPLLHMTEFGIIINIVLAVLNMLPIPPLDGGRVLTSILPGKLSWQLSRVEPYGFFILLGLLATGVLGKIMHPLISGIANFMLKLL